MKYFALLLILTASVTSYAQWPPSASLSLKEFKMKVPGSTVLASPAADGIKNDTQFILAALKQAYFQSQCLDGGGATYRVEGTIQFGNNVCLKNISLIQSMAPIDTSEYIKSGGEPAQYITIPEDKPNMLLDDVYVSYPQDPGITDPVKLAALKNWLSLRTLCLCGAPDRIIQVHLSNVKVNKGKVEYAGDRSSSAGIFVSYANKVYMNEVEVTGGGFGTGISVVRSENITLTKLNIHDITWSPYKGERHLTEAYAGDQFRWNGNPVYRFREKDLNGKYINKFVRQRVQEGANGLVVSLSKNVKISFSNIKNIGARFYSETGQPYVLPWQTDGITMNAINADIGNSNIEGSNEGIDFTGSEGTENFVLHDMYIANTFWFGVKMVHRTHNGIVRNVTVRNAGANAYVFNEPANNIIITDSVGLETGVVYANGKYNKFHFDKSGNPRVKISAVRVLSSNEPAAVDNIRIANSRFQNIQFPGLMLYGLVNDPQPRKPQFHVIEGDNVVSGYSAGRSSNFPQGPIALTKVKSEYQRINGCVGETMKMINFWDMTVSRTDGGIVWSFEELTKQLLNLKQREIFYCKAI
jgi:hypothetical protein